MKSHTSLVAQQTRLSEWADMVRDCPGQKNFQQRSVKLKYRWLQSSRLKMSRYSLFCVYTELRVLMGIRKDTPGRVPCICLQKYSNLYHL